MTLMEDIEALRKLWPETEWSRMTPEEIWQELDELRNGPEAERDQEVE